MTYGAGVESRIAELDWQRILGEIDQVGWATTGVLLTREERSHLIGAYDADSLFRSRVVMARHGFGLGEYRYFDYPLPDLVARLRTAMYRALLPLANRWCAAIGLAEPFPNDLPLFLARCRAAGQSRPTPLLLRYGAGDYNCLHQDIYGDEAFPLQAAFLLSEPGKFSGGEFVLTEQRPRMQSRVHVVPLAAGEAVIFAGNRRPVAGTRGTYRVAMRHGVSQIREGNRHTLGVIFHDAQ